MKEGNINDLKFDKKNFNKHTARGMALLGKSLKEHGAGRSVLVDKDNNLIGGNGVVESARKAGIKKTIVVETTGEELVVVKRTDVSLDSKQGREMALADNSTAAADLNWDFENLKELDKWEIKADDWGAEIISPDQFGDDFTLPVGEQSFKTMTFTFSVSQAEIVADALKSVVADECEDNDNVNGNKLYTIVRQWADVVK